MTGLEANFELVGRKAVAGRPGAIDGFASPFGSGFL